MDSTIPYLQRLEADLELVAKDAAAGRSSPRGPKAPRWRRPTSRSWKAWTGAAAALLVLAWGIGSFSPAEEKFNQVGSAVSGGEADLADPAAAPAPADVPAGLAYEPWTRNGVDASVEDLGGATASPAAGVDIAKIDRDGSLTLKLEEGEFKRTFTEVILIADENGGMLLVSQTQGPDSGTLTLRIPAENFDRAFAAVSQLGAVRESSITGKDVTAQYLDLEAHLRIAKGRRAVLFGLYEQADTIPETLSIYNELEQVQLQIEGIEGDLRYLDAQTSISTLKVTMSEREPEPVAQQQDPDVENPSLARAWDRAVQGFLGVVAAVVVGLGYLVPVAILAAIGLSIFMLSRRLRRGAS